MSIYTYYPKVNYKVDDFNYIKSIDITSSLKLKDYLKEYRGISYVPYVIQDGERPDYVSYKLYGSPEYDWIIMLTNNIYSIYDDWPKNSSELEEYIIQKYGSLNSAMSTVKYYYNSVGDIIDETTYNNLASNARSSETEYEYELKLNLNKSRIKVIKKNLISAINSDLNSINKKPVV